MFGTNITYNGFHFCCGRRLNFESVIVLQNSYVGTHRIDNRDFVCFCKVCRNGKRIWPDGLINECCLPRWIFGITNRERVSNANIIWIPYTRNKTNRVGNFRPCFVIYTFQIGNSYRESGNFAGYIRNSLKRPKTSHFRGFAVKMDKSPACLL